MSKGLTPVIAMILLLMMTVAAAGASFYWLLRIQGELQGGTQQFQEQTFEQMTSVVGWQTATYKNGTVAGDADQLTITVVNRGTTKIPIDNTSSSGVNQLIYLPRVEARRHVNVAGLGFCLSVLDPYERPFTPVDGRRRAIRMVPNRQSSRCLVDVERRMGNMLPVGQQEHLRGLVSLELA